MTIPKLSTILITLLTLSPGISIAQQEAAVEAAGPVFTPIDVFTCNYKKGKGRADMDKVIAGWNKWMDESNAEPYSAWIYTAYYGSPEYHFDIAWLGVWQDGKSMGKATDHWLTDGGAQAAAFDKVVDCKVHANFASTQMRSGGSENADSAVLGFSDCKVKEGTKFPDMMKAAADWNAYYAKQGSVASEWFFFPVYGADPDWHFKKVNAHPNYAALGADYDWYGNGGGFMKAQEIIGGAYECGVARIYNSERVRAGLPTQ